MLLCCTPYSSHFWLTFKQAKELGGTVRKGERGKSIFFYKQFEGRKGGEGKQDGKRTPFMLTSYSVFIVEQCDGLKLPETLPASAPDEFSITQACAELVPFVPLVRRPGHGRCGVKPCSVFEES